MEKYKNYVDMTPQEIDSIEKHSIVLFNDYRGLRVSNTVDQDGNWGLMFMLDNENHKNTILIDGETLKDFFDYLNREK